MDRRIAQRGFVAILLISSSLGISAWARAAWFTRSSKNAPAPRTAQSAQPIQWFHDLPSAHRASMATGRPMLIVFGASWCTYCRKLEAEVLAQPVLSKFINTNFIAVHLDFEKDRRIAQVLEVKSLPTSVILNPEADLLGTIEGYVKAREYAEVLKESIEFQRTLQSDRAIALRPASR